MRTSLLFALPAALIVATGCDLSEKKEDDTPACSLVGNNLDGETFVMVEAKPEGDTLNTMARMRFDKEGDDLTLKYSIKSLVNVVDYTCSEGRKGRLECVSEPDLERICRSLEVHEEGSCTKEKIAELGFEVSDEALAKAQESTKADIAKVKGTPQWDRYKLMFNNVANAVQFVVYAKVDERKCRLNVDDMMNIVYEGKRKQDYNPVGANPFTRTDDTLLFEDCPNERVLADHDAPELPEDLGDLKPLSTREVGKPVHYFYLDEVALEPEEGCTYSADLYANYKQVESDVAIEIADEKVQWNPSHTWKDSDRMALAQGKKGGIFTMVRKKTCGETTEIVDAVCNYTVF